MKNTNKLGHARGFTLIELLVVIAIIGILASVVLASLNTARDKGASAAVKSNLNNARAQAEIFYDNGVAGVHTYEGVCANAGTSVIGPLVSAAASSGGTVYTTGDATVQSAAVSVCHDAAAGWAAAASLMGTTSAWCVDSTGASKFVGQTVLGNADITCD